MIGLTLACTMAILGARPRRRVDKTVARELHRRLHRRAAPSARRVLRRRSPTGCEQVAGRAADVVRQRYALRQPRRRPTTASRRTDPADTSRRSACRSRPGRPSDLADGTVPGQARRGPPTTTSPSGTRSPSSCRPARSSGGSPAIFEDNPAGLLRRRSPRLQTLPRPASPTSDNYAHRLHRRRAPTGLQGRLDAGRRAAAGRDGEGRAGVRRRAARPRSTGWC